MMVIHFYYTIRGHMKKYKLMICIGLLAMSESSAHAFCTPPSTSYSYTKPTKPSEPTKPFCINGLMGTHSCDDFTISRYNNEVDSYNEKIRTYNQQRETYILEIESYLMRAKNYATCELDSLD